jgi:hypothetical protein
VEAVVLVIGMRGGLHEHGGRPQLPQHQPESDRPILEVERTHAQLRRELVVSGFSRT